MQSFKTLIFCLLLISCQSLNNNQAAEWWKVTEVVDGDTFHAVSSSGVHMKIRLIGLDAPETRITGKKTTGYFGKESSGYLKALVEGKNVFLEFDVSRNDQYGRTLAYVFLENGTFVNEELIKGGYARVMTIPPNVRYADEFLRLQKRARRQEKGLWGESIED